LERAEESRAAELPERALPANPNCVSFAADAREVLAGRPWADVLREAARAALPFHEACGLACAVGFSWRVQLDRKNVRHLQATMYFVFDGPASSAHLDRLERSVREVRPSYGAGSIERVPATGVLAILVRDGAAHSLVSSDGGEAYVRRLRLRGAKIRPEQVPLREAGPDVLPEELARVRGIPPGYGEADRESERMRLAFAMHFTRRIVEADGVVREGEEEFVSNVFPTDLVSRLGLDDEGVRAEYFEAAGEALKAQLGHHDKLGLVGLFFSACYSDGSLDAREMRVLREAGEMLGLTREEVVKYLRRFW
jgi:uncharacterized tellurite resistance protein B-like protein